MHSKKASNTTHFLAMNKFSQKLWVWEWRQLARSTVTSYLNLHAHTVLTTALSIRFWEAWFHRRWSRWCRVSDKLYRSKLAGHELACFQQRGRICQHSASEYTETTDHQQAHWTMIESHCIIILLILDLLCKIYYFMTFTWSFHY